MRLPVLLLSFALLSSASAPAAAFKVDGGLESFTLPFRMVDNRGFIAVRLNGEGPFHFILDTGAVGRIVRPAAQRVGLKVVNESLQSGVGENKVMTGETRGRELQIGDAHFFAS